MGEALRQSYSVALILLVWACWCCMISGVVGQTSPKIVYMVILRDSAFVHHNSVSAMATTHHAHSHHSKPGKLHKMQTPRKTKNPTRDLYTSYLVRVQDSLLKRTLERGTYKKLYSYHYLINGFAVLINPQQAEKLSTRPEVSQVTRDFSVDTSTTHTPDFIGLPKGAWVQDGGPENAGEGIVIGFIDTGIEPTHPSFSDKSTKAYLVPPHFTGVCEVTSDFPSRSCNRKLIGAHHFAASAIARGIFNASEDHASPYDGTGHGTHIASIAAGNHGVPVIVGGHQFGNASGMAPRAQYLLHSYTHCSISASFYFYSRLA